jgi:hypothetical protein
MPHARNQAAEEGLSFFAIRPRHGLDANEAAHGSKVSRSMPSDRSASRPKRNFLISWSLTGSTAARRSGRATLLNGLMQVLRLAAGPSYWLALAALGLAVLGAESASATLPTKRYPTAVTVEQLTVNPNQSLTVSGRVDGKWFCNEQREVGLWIKRTGHDEPVDVGFSSLFGATWATRSYGGSADGVNRFYVKASRLVLKIQGRHGQIKKRAICEPDRASVSYAP